MFGLVKGYEIADVSKKKLGKENLTSFDNAEEIQKSAYAALESKGKVYLFRNAQKQCVCCYVLHRVKGYTAPGDLDISANGKAVLVLEKISTNLDVEMQEQFDTIVLQEVKELICFTDINAVQWNDQLITAKDVEHEITESWYIWVSLALLWGIVFDNWAVGIFLGIIFASASGLFEYVKKKKDTDGKKD